MATKKMTVPGVQGPKGMKAIARPLRPPRKTILPQGPKSLRPDTKPTIVTGPNVPPPGFLTGNNSRSEWVLYWALERVLGPEQEGVWMYQGRLGGHTAGSSKPDFVIYNQEPPVVLRLQSERYHINVSSYRQFYDTEQRLQLERMGYRVIDIYEQDMGLESDPTGRTTIRLVVDALQGRQRINPIAARTALARG